MFKRAISSPYEISQYSQPSRQALSTHNKRVALVLGAGAARGFAHLGVIEELEARGYEIVGVAGCSIGALVGGIYAAGKLKDFREWITNLSYLELFKLIDFTWNRLGTIKGDRLMRRLALFLGDAQIEDLALPFTSVATDLINQKEIWFQNGSLEQAIRASIAVPGVLTPVNYKGRVLVDGGLVNPLPLNQIAAWHADLTIAVNVTANVKSSSFSGLTKQMLKLNAKQEAQVNKLNILLQSFDITQAALAQYKIAGYPPDILIEVPRNICSSFEFHRAKELIALGQKLAHKQLKKWEAMQPWLSGDLDG